MAWLHDLVVTLGGWCVDVVLAMGYPGVFLLMTLESMIFPVPSEFVLPPAGWLAWRGDFNFWWALVAATLGTITGSLLSYWMGLKGMRPLIAAYGKYFFVTEHHLEQTERFFVRRRAAVAVFVSRFVPVVRHLISIPAGGARMPLGPFLLATTLGGLGWNAILLYAGFALGENWRDIEPLVSDTKFVILGVVALGVLLGVGYYLVRRRKAAKAS